MKETKKILTDLGFKQFSPTIYVHNELSLTLQISEGTKPHDLPELIYKASVANVRFQIQKTLGII